MDIAISSDVKKLLEQHGPGCTTDLIQAMTKTGLLEAAARQRISRAQGEYTRLAGIRLEKNTRFIYLEDQYGSIEFWTALEKAFAKYGPAYWGAIAGLSSRGGIWPKKLFPIITAAPLARKGQLSPDRILERLININFLREVDGIEDELFIQFNPGHYHVDSLSDVSAVRVVEEVALLGIKDWLRKIGFASYNKIRCRGEDDAPVVAGITWDLSGPSYIRPLVSAKAGKMKPAFVVCDINLRGIIQEDFVKLFVRKHDMASAPIGVAPIMPMIIADMFSQKAFDLARQKGILATTTAQLFGTEIAESLTDLIKILADAGATASKNPEYLEKVFNKILKIQGASVRIMGSFFELVIGTLVKNVEGGFLATGRKATHLLTGKKVEIDVLLDRDDNIVHIIECKSKLPGGLVDAETVRKWYDERVPLIFDILSKDKRYKGKAFRFEIWTNGIFHPDALGWLLLQKTIFPGYNVGWCDGAEIKTYAEKATEPSIRTMLKDHFFTHPLTAI